MLTRMAELVPTEAASILSILLPTVAVAVATGTTTPVVVMLAGPPVVVLLLVPVGKLVAFCLFDAFDKTDTSCV